MEKRKNNKEYAENIIKHIKEHPKIWQRKDVRKALADVQNKKGTSTRKAPNISLECTIEVPKNSILIRSKSIQLKKDVNTLTIPFEIKVKFTEWEKFLLFWNFDQGEFIEQLKKNLHEAVIKKICEEAERSKPPGINRSKHDLIQFLKSEAEYLYVLFSILCGMPFKETPLWFQNLVNKYDEDKNFFGHNGNIDPEKFVALCLSAVYLPEMNQHGLTKYFDIKSHEFNLKNLRRTYIFNKPGGKGKHLTHNATARKKSIEDKLKHATLKGHAKYLTRKNSKYPLPYTDQLAVSIMTKPCDKWGGFIKVRPCLGKNESLLNAVFDIYYDIDGTQFIRNITLQSLIQP